MVKREAVVITGEFALLVNHELFFLSLTPRDRLRIRRNRAQKTTMTMAKMMAAMPPEDNLLDVRLAPVPSPLLL